MSSIVDTSSEDEHSEMLSDDLEENIDSDESDGDHDPDYVPSVPMEEDEANTETQPGASQSSAASIYSDEQNVESSAASIHNDEQNAEPSAASIHNDEQNAEPSAASIHNEEKNAEPSRAVDMEEKSAIVASQGSSSDENCTICFEPWTTTSEHRLVSLRCGHLFGRSCISQWLKGQNSRCPQCNARARRSEIRNIYARSIKVIDSTERDKALKELMQETKLRRAAEQEAAQERMKHCLAVQECERLKKELMEAQKQLQEFRSGMKKLRDPNVSKKPPFKALQHITICNDGGCRIVNSGDLLGMLLVSQPSSNKLFPGFGFRKVSTMTLKPCDFVLVHKKVIRDMALHAHDGLVLTGSIDKSLKITNVLSNTVVQTYEVESDVWSCAWDTDNPMYFYGGLKTGEALVFDIRMTNRYVCELPRFGVKTPVVSLQYLPKPAFSGHGMFPPSYGGPIVGKLSDCALHQKTANEGIYNLVPMPSLGPFTCLSSGGTGQLLVSCRPSVTNPVITHTYCDFLRAPTGEITCCPVRTVFGGKTQVQLTRSQLFSHPDNASSVLICAGDEESEGALVWDGSSGDLLEKLRTETPVLDFAAVKVDQKFYLTALTSKKLHVYKWNSL